MCELHKNRNAQLKQVSIVCLSTLNQHREKGSLISLFPLSSSPGGSVVIRSISMQALILQSLRHLREEKERLRTQAYERESAQTERKERLRSLEQEVRESNRTEGRRTIRHASPWGVDQRQFSSELLRQKQREGDVLRAQRREERRLAVNLGRTRIGLDFIPDLTVPRKKEGARTGEVRTERCLHATDLQVRRYIHFKRKREQNRAKLKELQAERKELRREWALEALDHDCKRTTKPTRRKLRRRTRPQCPPQPSPPKPLYKRLRGLLSARIENLRDSALLLPLSLGASQRQMEFPVSEEDCSTSRSQRRKLRRRVESLKERYEQVRDKEEQQDRDWAARVIQRWYRTHRAEEVTSELRVEKEISDIYSGRFSLSAVEFCGESGPCSDSGSRDMLVDRFKEALAVHSQSLESRIFAYTAQLEIGLACAPATALEESLLSPPAVPSMPILLPAESCPEPDSTMHRVSPSTPLFIIPEPAEDVPLPEASPRASFELLSRSVEEMKLERLDSEYATQLPFCVDLKPLARKRTQ